MRRAISTTDVTNDSDHLRVVEARAPLRLRGDWGGVNLTRTCGWLANWVWKETPDHRLSVIHTGRGMGDNLRALAAGEVDVAVITPACFAMLAAAGRGPFADRAMPELRAIAALPHRDAMLFAGHERLGIKRLTDLRRCKPAIRLSIGACDRDGFMGLGARIILEAAGIDLDDIAEWGGSVRYHEEPFGSLADLDAGLADAIITEAIMTPEWVRLSQRVPIRFVGLTDEESTAIRSEWGLGTVTVPAGYLTGMSEDVVTLDYADWLIVATSALPDADAGLLARAVVENAASLESQYRHLPVERSPLHYPITTRHAAATPIPLHPAAAAVYASAGAGQGAHQRGRADTESALADPATQRGDMHHD